MACQLEFTDDRFVFAGKSYAGIPLLVDSSMQFVMPVCNYLRDLVICLQLKTTSVKTYAQHIQQFWNFLESQDKDYSETTDHLLLRWLNQMELRGNKGYVRAQRCDAIFDLFCWLEKNGYLTEMVEIPGFNDSHKFIPKLTSKKARQGRYRASRYGIVSAIRPNARDIDGVQPTPTLDDVTKIYVASDNLDNEALTDRNHLLIDWYAQVGLRRMEAQHLSVSQIPGWPAIDEWRRLGHVYELDLTITKGGKARYVGVLPNLLEKTLEYIEGPRQDIVDRFKGKKGHFYKEPSELFLSAKTGYVLSLTALTNLFTHFFGAARVEGHGHRLRAHYLQKLVEAEVSAAVEALVLHGGSPSDIDWELILRKVAERAGHQNIDTLRKYITLAKKKFARMAGREDSITIKQTLIAQKHELALVEHRLEKKREELAALTLRG